MPDPHRSPLVQERSYRIFARVAVSSRIAFLVGLLLGVTSCWGEPFGPARMSDPVATTISLSSGAVTFTALSETQQLTATVLDQTGIAMSGASVTWTSSDAQTASVSSTGLVTAIAEGTATITARYGSVSNMASASVHQIAASLHLAPDSLVLAGPGDKGTITALLLDAGSSEIASSTLAWSSDSEDIATVSRKGLVTAVATGSVLITAEVTGDGPPVTDELPVTIEDGLLSRPEGGEVAAAAGAVKLTFPAGALAEAVFITVRPAAALEVQPPPIPETAYEFGPDGIVFGQPVTLAVSYDPADLPQGVAEEDLRLYKVVDGEYLPVEGSAVDIVNHTVSGVIHKFSVYAILPRLRVTTTSLPDGVENVGYGPQTLTVRGGAPGRQWSVVSGSLPTGLDLSADGLISGTPVAAGSWEFTVQVTSGHRTAQQEISFVVHSTLGVTTTTAASGVTGVAYHETLTATGGDGEYSWLVTDGTLPAGLSLATSGEITGTPEASGSSAFTVEVTSGDAQVATRQLTMDVHGQLAVTTAALQSGITGATYNGTAAAAGGDGEYSWRVTDGTLPAGLSLAKSGEVTGTPEASGSSAFTVEVTSGDAQVATRQLTIVVYGPLDVISASPLPTGVEGAPYAETLDATGGDGNYTWSVSLGALPTGLSLAVSTGAISGNPTVAGQSTFTVQVTTGDGQAATKQLTIDVAVVYVAAVEMSPVQTLLQVGSQAVLTAVARDQLGRALDGRVTLWASDDASVSVTSDGTIQAVAPGQATVTGTVEGVSASATVMVGLAVSTVDFGAPTLDPASMSGILHGFSFDGGPLPDDDVVLPLRPPIWRSTPDVVPIEVAEQAGARYNLVLSDFWGYPSEGWPNGRPFEQPDEYVEMMREIATQYRGMVDIWEIWNEPDLAPHSWDGTEEQFFETYRMAYDALREVLGPSAKIEGPSLARFDADYLRRFADYCVANGCEANVLSWHEMGVHRPLSVIADHLVAIRSEYVGAGPYAALGTSEIHINESVGPPETYDPAGSLTYLQYLERGGADAAARACWVNDCFNNSLGGLLTEAGEPRPVWWAYAMYADGVATRVGTTLSDGRVLTLASSSSISSGRPTVLMGYSRTSDTSLPTETALGLRLVGLDHLVAVAGETEIRVVIEEVPPLGTAPLLTPIAFLDTVLPVSDSQTLVLVPGVRSNAVYRLGVHPR